jgi:hypothetical protein
MKTMILVAAVAAFEFSFVASIATSPAGPGRGAASAQAGGRSPASVSQRVGAQLPCTPPG